MYPILFTIPVIHLPIYSYGVMLGLSLIVAWYFIMHMGSKDGLPRDIMGNAFLWTAVTAILGARVLYVVTNLDEFSGGTFFDYLNIRKGGLVAYGGFLGGFLGSWVYIRRHGIRLLPWADVVTPTLATGLAITRVGCLLYGCDFGKVTDVAWAIRFPNWKVRFPELYQTMQQGAGCAKASFSGAPAFSAHVNQGLLDIGASQSLPVHPTQIYESLTGLFLFGLLMLVWRHRSFRGQIFLLFTIGYGAIRFFLEFYRGDSERGNVGVLSTSQFVGAFTFALAVGFYVWLWLKARRHPEEASAAAAEPEPDPSAANRWRRRRKKK